MTESSRREKDLPMAEEFEYVRAIDPNGRSVNVPKSLFGGNLDVASEEVLGGVKASPKSETDTNEVKIDPETGKLYCPPSEVAMATSEKIGGIVAEVKTSEETEEVKIDPNTGKAYVKPSSKLGMATSETLGGVKASEKTEGYTTEVKIDSKTGKLYVPKGEGTPPDEEDITLASLGDSNVLQFKNRERDKGMGYVILRSNKTIAEQMIQDNTIYEIRYDFDLDGETLEIPANCVLDFKGGSFSNGTLQGSNTKIAGDPTYSIFNDTIIKGFNIGYIDVRWVGGIPDYKSTSEIGTDNALYFDRAIKACGKNVGAYVKVIGRYTIASTVEVKYDLNLVGEYYVNRSFWTPSSDGYVDTDVVEEGCNSMIYVPNGVTAFKVVGRGLDTRKSANISLNNLRLRGAGQSSSSIFIEFTATGAPPRVGKFAECVCSGFNKVLYFHDLGEFSDGTIYGNLTIEKVVAYYCNQFIVAKASGNLVPTLCNLIIKDSNIEQNGEQAIYLENLFGPNIIDNNILENSPNCIYATIINGSLNVTNNYFEQQGGSYMIKVSGKNMNQCFLTCTNNYRVNADQGLLYDITGMTVLSFENIKHSNNDVKFDGCTVADYLFNKCSTVNIGDSLGFRHINYGRNFPFAENQFLLKWGGSRIERGLYGKKGHTGNSRVARVKIDVAEDDELWVVYYTSGSTHSIYLCDDNGSRISEFAPDFYYGSGVVFAKFTINTSSPYINVWVNSSSIDLGNGFIYKNVGSINLRNMGIAFPDKIDANAGIENMSASVLRGLAWVSESVYDGLFFSDGTNKRNSDGSFVSKVEIVSKYTNYTTFTKANTIYKIAGDLDMDGQTVNMPAGCAIDFSLGGTITNGTISLNSTMLYPQCLDVSAYVTATIKGSYKNGQVIYDPDAGKLKLRHGGNWVNLDGSII